MSSYNPHVLEVSRMFAEVFSKYSEEIDVATLDWKELKDSAGNVFQIVPVVQVVNKG